MNGPDPQDEKTPKPAKQKPDSSAPQDGFTRSWLDQATLRMRRELCWLWRERGASDRLGDWLQKDAATEARLRFFGEDITAKYLDENIRETRQPLRGRSSARGSFSWLARELHLTRAEIFFTALAYAAAREGVAGSLIATLHGDPQRTLPTLALAQWLWDDPVALAPLSSPSHPLFARGILRRLDTANEWHAPIFMPMSVAQFFEGHVKKSPELDRIAEPRRKADTDAAAATGPSNEAIELLAGRMAYPPHELHVAPVSVEFAGDLLDAKRAAPIMKEIAALTGRPIYATKSSIAMTPVLLENAALYCWLSGADLLVASQEPSRDAMWQNALRPFPIYVFVAAPTESQIISVPTLPVLRIGAPEYAQRRSIWQTELAKHHLEADTEAIKEAVREAAYRFRLDAPAIAEIVTGLSRTPGPLTRDRVLAASQQQAGLAIGAQATVVKPRFRRSELVLDPQRSAQFDQLLSAMNNLSRVHADWGMGSAWRDSGVSAMFAGPPGTGKTMSAEVLAAELNLPMYHVDLSQILNKYIGETEKNLRRLFDAAEQSDIVLFFDEAEAIFGQRVQARTANDRFSNIEVSYLLERMDRFRGLAILATNRKKDLDEAFLRRLRYVIDFAMPAETERKAIWTKSIPEQISTKGIDIAFLAREFPLAGGNIRSIVLNACLHAASTSEKPALTMDAVMNAVDREYEKLGRPLTPQQKAQWQPRPKLGIVR